MTRLEKLAVATFGVLSAAIVLRHGESAMQASVPGDMPGNSRFIQSGYDLNHNQATGIWIACRPNVAEADNWCRVTEQKGIVLYQGEFLPVASDRVIPSSELQVAVPDPLRMWVEGPVERGPVPVILLAGGDVLVPAGDRTALRERWERTPEEFRRVTGQF